MKTWSVYLFLFFPLLSVRASGAGDLSKDIHYLTAPPSPENLGSGYTVQDHHNPAQNLLNPALFTTRFGFGMAWEVIQTPERFNLIHHAFGIPLSYGTISGGVLFLDYDNQFLRYNDFFGAYAAYNMEIIKNLFLGMGTRSDILGQSVTLGVKIPFYSSIRFGRWIGMKNLTYAGALRNVYLNATEYPVEPEIEHGLGFDWVQTRHFTVSQNIVMAFNPTFENERFGIGLGVSYGLMEFNVGSRANQLMNVDAMTSSFGLNWQSSYGSFRLSVGSEFAQNKPRYVSIGIRAQIRGIGNPTNEVFGKVEPEFISPANLDGVHDIAVLSLVALKEKKLMLWEVLIVSPENEIVRKISSEDKDYRKRKKTFPSEVVWNGRDNYGNLLPDGLYKVKFKFIRMDRKVFFLNAGSVNVDNQAPFARLELPETELRIKEGESRNFVSNLQNIATNENDLWKFTILDPFNNEIYSEEKRGDKLATTYEWNFYDQYGRPVETGNYIFCAEARDKAGNRFPRVCDQFRLIRESKFSVSLNPGRQVFSPNGDGKFDRMFFYLNVKKPKAVRSWKVSIFSMDGNLVKTFLGTASDLKSVVFWSGKDSAGRLVPDGNYQVQFRVAYKNGVTSKSIPSIVRVDTIKPDFKITYSPSLFSPDGDGVDEVVNFSISPVFGDAINQWKLRIFSPGYPRFKVYSGQGDPPDEIHWDGTSQKGTLAPSMATFRYEFSAIDKGGNRFSQKGGPIETDFLIFKLSNELKIKSFGILFASGKSQVYPAIYPKLDKIAHLMRGRLKGFHLKIVGHTDQTGAEEKNYELGLERAKSVYEYLVRKNGINAEDISYDSKGETEPVTRSANPARRVLNRRVEFIFTKVNKKIKQVKAGKASGQ